MISNLGTGQSNGKGFKCQMISCKFKFEFILIVGLTQNRFYKQIRDILFFGEGVYKHT